MHQFHLSVACPNPKLSHNLGTGVLTASVVVPLPGR